MSKYPGKPSIIITDPAILLPGNVTAFSIVLTKGLKAFISPEDIERVKSLRWYADCNPWTDYAKTDQAEGRPRLHVYIMQPTYGHVVHHKDNNGLNNTRSNLEVITQAEHSRLSKLRRNKTTSKYRGVYFHKPTGKYAAEITLNYKKHYLGLFETEEQAATAYNNAALNLFGKDCLLNEVSLA